MYTENILPISIKGILVENGSVWLRKNPRGEWELPGGRLEVGEDPETTVIRELHEELGYEVIVKNIVHSGVLSIALKDQTKNVFIVSYLCEAKQKTGGFELVGEDGSAEFKMFKTTDLDLLTMPKIYKDAITSALRTS